MNNDQNAQLQQYINQVVSNVHAGYKDVTGNLVRDLATRNMQVAELEFMLKSKEEQISSLQEEIEKLQGLLGSPEDRLESVDTE